MRDYFSMTDIFFLCTFILYTILLFKYELRKSLSYPHMEVDLTAPSVNELNGMFDLKSLEIDEEFEVY